jgi:hypothetical protein
MKSRIPVAASTELKCASSWVLVDHAYNPSHSRGKDQESRVLKPVLANRSQNPILKKSITKKGW